MAKNHTKHGKQLADEVETCCKDCTHKPEDKEYCNEKKRPVSESHSCKDDFKAKKSAKVITTKPKAVAKPVVKKKPQPTTPKPKEELSLREQRDEAIATLMDGAKEVVIFNAGLRISITKETT